MSAPLGWRFHAQYQAHLDSYDLFVRFRDGLGRDGFHFVQPLTMQTVADGAFYDTPTITDTPRLRESREDGVAEALDVQGFLQAAMDEAWRIGLRPSAFADTTQELAAVRYHLEDMRKIAKVPGAA